MPKPILADILTRFNHRHPLVEIAVTCENSIELAALIHAGALELALVTDHDGPRRLRTDPRGAAGLDGRDAIQDRGGRADPAGARLSACIWRKVADEALEGRRERVRGLFVSKNYTAIGSVVRAGLAATVLPQGMLGDGLRRSGRNGGFLACRRPGWD